MRQEGRSSGASEAPSTEPERLEVELVRDGERLRCEAMSLGFELLSNLAGHVGVLSAETREKGEKDFVDHGCITSNLRYPLRQEIYSVSAVSGLLGNQTSEHISSKTGTRTISQELRA